MSGKVKIRTLFVDPDAAPHLPRTSCVIAVSPLLRELIVAAAGIPTDYALGTRDERLLLLLLDELRELDVLPLHLPTPRDLRLRTICDGLTSNPDDITTAEQWAERLSITPKTLHRLFAKEAGMSFVQWRQQARLLLVDETTQYRQIVLERAARFRKIRELDAAHLG